MVEHLDSSSNINDSPLLDKKSPDKLNLDIAIFWKLGCLAGNYHVTSWEKESFYHPDN